ncbi:MAG: hypothetical protein KDB63_06835, partial [Nocardioidaceae bacterium]|nr:hypothetical protein [Nocardioidaceae bacterium]
MGLVACGIVGALLVAGLQVLPAAPASATVPAPPSAVTPIPTMEVVTTPGPTQVSADITRDTVWGPTGSPYVVQNSITVTDVASLTLLPGTVVKFKPGVKLGVRGQFLSLGTPQARVSLTSFADDSVAGDTNGDGASTGAAGDWVGVETFKPTLVQASVMVLDYTDVRFGGQVAGTGSPNCLGGAMVSSGTSTRVLISNSTFSDSLQADLGLGMTLDGFAGVYNSEFGSAACGVHDSGVSDYVGNTFDGTFTQGSQWAFIGTGMDGGRFWYNTFLSGTMVNSRGGMSIRYNHLNQIASFGSAGEQFPDYRRNHWNIPITASPVGDCMTGAQVDAYAPPILTNTNYDCP